MSMYTLIFRKSEISRVQATKSNLAEHISYAHPLSLRNLERLKATRVRTHQKKKRSKILNVNKIFRSL